VSILTENSVEEKKASDLDTPAAITSRPAEARSTLEKHENDLEKAAADESRSPLLMDFLYFLGQNKKWWLLPILIILLLLSVLMLLSSSAAAPFIYTLF
jgi:hypothetical protein